ncbi:hypothetical protein ARMGADRAFT_1026555 [Armillaria gallica]|uniref:DNA replication complex GINS protein SLD5 n=1 Tax=Armillaria gallica TaxID=47427 RepID=A0A2H3DTP9_ARMGA|nr:hypothetical protein ARMGADRAFT_1026555 [Armillaria gallica]
MYDFSTSSGGNVVMVKDNDGPGARAANVDLNVDMHTLTHRATPVFPSLKLGKSYPGTYLDNSLPPLTGWDDEHTLLATSSKGGALDFLNLDVPAPTAAETPLSELIRHWMNERHAPTILAAQEQLLGLLLDHIRRQVHSLVFNDGRGTSPSWRPLTSEEEHIRIMLVQTEVERVFIVRLYIRTWLYKIEKYAQFITADAEIQTRLTTAEKACATSQAPHTYRHLHYSVLQSLPLAQAHLDDQPIFVPPMVTQPKRFRAVFAYAPKEWRPVRLPDRATLTLEKDRLTLVPFYVVEHLVERGDAELV